MKKLIAMAALGLVMVGFSVSGKNTPAPVAVPDFVAIGGPITDGNYKQPLVTTGTYSSKCGGVDVYLYDACWNEVESGSANCAGGKFDYTFKGVPNGKYYLKVSLVGTSPLIEDAEGPFDVR